MNKSRNCLNGRRVAIVTVVAIVAMVTGVFGIDVISNPPALLRRSGYAKAQQADE